MEGAGHRGRWNKKAPVGTILLLMCMFTPTLTLLQPSAEQKCPDEDYLTENGICCNKCSPGFKLVEKCHAVLQRSNCTRCPPGQYTDQMNFFPNCLSCRSCKKTKRELEVSKCERHRNTICVCVAGYYKFNIDSETYECRRCTQCGQDEKLKDTCTPEKNTVCECTENYYKVNGKCKPCKNCTAECKQHCSLPTVRNTKEAPISDEFLINIITGVAVGAVVLLVVVFVITHVATKWLTKKKLLKSSTQPSEASCEKVLIHNEDPSEASYSVEAVPQSPVSEQEPSNLPDCIPLEVNISDLIYTVLDLVPVSQVKQLVRSLGVKDTEIEQVEFDHRSCREAYYQMLRMWAERGSRTGGGGRGRILHWPLLQELLDKLRAMHLGRAAEELETKYGIQ